MEPIGILYMIPLLYGYAGTEKHLLSVVSHIDRKRFVPHVLYFRGRRKVVELFERNGVVCEEFKMMRIYGLEAIKNIWKMREYIKRNKIRILQTFHPNADLYGPIVGRMSGVSIIISSRRDLGLNRKYIKLQKGVNHLVHQMIAPSKAVKKVIVENENVSEDKVKLIYNGIDIEFFAPNEDKSARRSEMGLEDANFVIITVANLYKIKGVEYFIRAASLIAQEVPEARFIIVGDGAEKDPLTELAANLGVLRKITFIGNIDNTKEYLAASDVYVCSSLSEGFSNSILEAMAMGLPAVATDVGGNREAIVDNESGFLVPAQDCPGIASKVIGLYRDQEMRNQMGDEGRRIAEERFDLKRMIKEHEKIYLDLIDQMV